MVKLLNPPDVFEKRYMNADSDYVGFTITLDSTGENTTDETNDETATTTETTGTKKALPNVKVELPTANKPTGIDHNLVYAVIGAATLVIVFGILIFTHHDK